MIHVLAPLGGLAAAPEPALAWTSENRQRVLLRVDARGVRRSSSVATVALDLAAELARAARRDRPSRTRSRSSLRRPGRPRVPSLAWEASAIAAVRSAAHPTRA